MSTDSEPSTTSETQVITVRYWAAARSAAGVDTDALVVQGAVSLAEVMAQARALHRGSRLGDVLEICSVLVGDRPSSTEDPADVVVQPGSTVEFLPPFAGG